jgi:catechol 2,3-dioxygenase-like lactoylglutathione lyase family enzyme
MDDRTIRGAEDDRPPIWAGHLGPLVVADLDDAIDFYRRLGFRPATRRDDLVSLEMRGGTHLVLLRGEEEPTGREAPFDLMVDDLPTFRARVRSAGIKAGPIEVAGTHHRCWVTDPGGHRIRIHDSHVVGPV